jgi:hypothetical protein
MFDALLEFGFFDDPAQVVWVARGDRVIPLPAVFAEVEAGVQSGFRRSLHKFTPASVLDQFFENGGRHHHVESDPVR